MIFDGVNNLYEIGVYKIWHTVDTSKFYIGSSCGLIINRIYHHLSDLRNKKHHSRHLQNVVNKYGMDGLRCGVLAVCLNKEECLFMEQFYIDRLKPVYNTFKIVGSAGGHRHSQETKDNWSKQRKGVKQPPRSKEHCDRLSKNLKDRDKSYLRTKELNSKRSKTLKGRIVTENAYLASRKVVDQFSKGGEFIKRHISIGQAAIDIGVDRSNVSLVICGKRKSTGGFIFKLGK